MVSHKTFAGDPELLISVPNFIAASTVSEKLNLCYPAKNQ